jgi:lipid-A-disaccharide synthase
MVRLFISTGEVSGDLQGALLIESLLQHAKALGIELEIVALGGERMAAAGATLLSNTTTIGSVGLLEALPYVIPTLMLQRRAQQYLQAHPPDLVVLIDYLAANIAMGSFVRQRLPQVPIVYYIAPQEWVWSHSLKTTKKIIKISDRILAIFPAEAAYFQKHGGSVTWVGHPLVDRMQLAPDRQTARQQLGIPPEQTAIALLPASRRQELKSLLPPMFEAATEIQTKIPQAHFWIPLSLEKYRPAITQAIQDYGLRATVVSDSLMALAAADLAIAKSGTVNLETALLQVPQVVIYRVNPFNVWLYRTFLNFHIEYFSPPNLIEMRPIVPELIQDNVTSEQIAYKALELLLNDQVRQTMLDDYASMTRTIGTTGAVDRAAQEILKFASV